MLRAIIGGLSSQIKVLCPASKPTNYSGLPITDKCHLSGINPDNIIKSQ